MRWKSERERERQSKSRNSHAQRDENTSFVASIDLLGFTSLGISCLSTGCSVSCEGSEPSEAALASRLVSSHGRRLPVKLEWMVIEEETGKRRERFDLI